MLGHRKMAESHYHPVVQKKVYFVAVLICVHAVRAIYY